MKGGPIVIVVLVCSLALMVFTQQQSTSLRFEDRGKDFGSSYLKRSKMPTAGFDAMVSDFIWMKTILRKTLQLPSSLSWDEKKAMLKRDAEQNFAAYSKVVSLDPTFKKAYDFAMLRVMTDLPDQAIKMAEMGMIYCPDSKKELAELAGHIASTVRKDNEQALSFYGICVEGGPHKEYMGNRYLRTYMKAKGLDPDKEGMDAYAKKIFFYHDKHMALLKSEVSQYEGAPEGEALPAEHEEIVGAGSTWVQPLVIDEIKGFMNKALTNKVDNRTMGKIKGVYESYRTSDKACRRCLQAFEAGDRFCTQCGLGLETFGACLRDGAVLRGDFCHLCGLKKGQKPN